jgi:hypothetical protein
MSNKKELLNQALPKWPTLLVKGDPVTQDQAAEIILRTDSYFKWMSSNADAYDREFVTMFDRPYDGHGVGKCKWIDEIGNFQERCIADNAWHEKLNRIQLEYMGNSQICSSWIGGPHGWCDWEGNISTSNYNIGKWPSCEEVYDEWVRIAKSFPFLNLKCQLMDGETCEESTKPVIEFHIANGKVKVVKPKSQLILVNDDIGTSMSTIGLNAMRREVGISIEALRVKLLTVYGEIPKWHSDSYNQWMDDRSAFKTPVDNVKR